MYSYRFNPIFNRWVLVGTPLASSFAINAANLIAGGRDKDFLAATHPRHPFVFDPEDQKLTAIQERAYKDEAAVGEYELLLYQGKIPFGEWKAAEWTRWLSLLQQRILSFHHNPHLHNLSCVLDASLLASAGAYQRVGDLIATSHPLMAEAPLLTDHAAATLKNKESAYVLHEDAHGQLRVASAPVDGYELNYIPESRSSDISTISEAERKAAAEMLAAAVRLLSEEFATNQIVVRLYSSLGRIEGSSWWFRVYVPTRQTSALLVQPKPEKLVTTLKLMLGNR